MPCSGASWQLWAGLRHTRMDRRSERTSADGEGSLRATDYDRSATTPWLALAAQVSPKTLLYASWGRGLETDVAPNRARYINAGQSLALQSRQMEVGLKHGTEEVEAAITLFDIDRGQASDIGDCNANASCQRIVDGSARHRGLEAQWTQQMGPLGLAGQRDVAEGRTTRFALPGVNGQRPTNVPQATLRLAAEYRPAIAPGLALQASLLAEGNRVVLPYDPSVRASRVEPPGSGGPLATGLGRHCADLAPGPGQRHRPPRLERVTLPVWPCVLVPTARPQLAPVGTGCASEGQKNRAILLGSIPR
jgi:iron complex outermembrane receptor protein